MLVLIHDTGQFVRLEHQQLVLDRVHKVVVDLWHPDLIGIEVELLVLTYSVGLLAGTFKECDVSFGLPLLILKPHDIYQALLVHA